MDILNILITLGGLLGGGFILFKVRQSGKNAVIDQVNKAAKERKEKRDEIDNDVRGVDASAELRDNWTRPK
jgi:hypothetical protein